MSCSPALQATRSSDGYRIDGFRCIYRCIELSTKLIERGLVPIPWHPLILVPILNELGLTYRVWHSRRFYVSFIDIVLNFVDIISNYIDIVLNSIIARYPSLDGRQAPPPIPSHRATLRYAAYMQKECLSHLPPPPPTPTPPETPGLEMRDGFAPARRKRRYVHILHRVTETCLGESVVGHLPLNRISLSCHTIPR